MHDFGEYTPFDSTPFGDLDPFLYHNDYPRLWAKVCEEALEEWKAEHNESVVPFMRAGSTDSPKHTTLFWMGDQNPSLDQYDGLHSALIGMLNGGLSGFTIAHSDIGGYTTVDEFHTPLLDQKRSKETLQRWIEMSTFSDMIMRTHPGTSPDEMYQIYDEHDIAQFFARFVRIHISLKNYKANLMREASEEGVPAVRSMFLQYPEELEARHLKDQFCLGDDLIMAPVFTPGADSRDLYLPAGNWVHYFTKETIEMS